MIKLFGPLLVCLLGMVGILCQHFSTDDWVPVRPERVREAPDDAGARVVKEMEYALNEVNLLFNRTEEALQQQFAAHPGAVIDPLAQARALWAVHTQPLWRARERAFGAMAALAATKRFKKARMLEQPAALAHANRALRRICASARDAQMNCDAVAYRRVDGRCNNVREPQWGAQFSPFGRFLPADYGDGVAEPRRSSAPSHSSDDRGASLPNARLLSNLLFREPRPQALGPSGVSAMAAHWAALIHADLAHIGSTQMMAPDFPHASQPLPCCAMEHLLVPPGGGRPGHPECFPISVSGDDPRFRGMVTCLDYARTMVAPRSPNCSLGTREQANQATSFLDASFIYGSSSDQSYRLRALRDGKLMVTRENGHNAGETRRELPPTMETIGGPQAAQPPKCASRGLGACFVSGSEQVNFLPSLTALHTLFIRQHNRVATQLMALNRDWSDEQLFQTTRRIVIAQLQHITYEEWLPLVLGRERWVRSGLGGQERRQKGSHAEASANANDFELDLDGSALNEYASAVGLFFMTMLEGKFAHLSPEGIRSMDRPLGEWMYEPSPLMFSDRIDGIFRFMLRQPALMPGLHMSAELRDKLFRQNGPHGLDMAALIVQMGRDHGLPGYTRVREACGETAVNSFDDLVDIVVEPKRIVPIFARHFRHVHDVDLFLLGLAERPQKGALVGPTFACLLTAQFQTTMRGDRFWHSHRMDPWAFTEQQLAELRKTSLAQLICANTDVRQVQPRAFESSDDYDNFPVHCDNSSLMAGPDWRAWKDAESHIQMPFSMRTVRKAIVSFLPIFELGLERMLERRKRESQNIAKNQGIVRSGDVLFTYAQMMRPKREAIRVGRMSQVLLEATKLLMAGDARLLLEGHDNRVDAEDDGAGGDGPPPPVENQPPLHRMDAQTLQRVLAQFDISGILGNIEPFVNSIEHSGSVEECLPRDQPCDHTTPYRSPNGWCNNLRFPHYGSSFSPLRHLLPPVYDDGVDAPRSRAKNGHPLPSARLISNALHVDQPFEHSKFTHMVMQFGQILDHEVTHSPVERGPNDEVLNCTRCDSPKTLSEHCMPLPVPEGDPFFPKFDHNGEPRCLPFARSVLGQLTLGYRNQLNQLTSFIDGSAIYGSTQCEAAALRAFEGGRLNSTNLGPVNTEALPQGDQEQDCRGKPRFPCFVAGDERNSHQPGLTTIHNMFLREHNRIARQLQAMNTGWNDEKLYQETRRIVGALFQHIVFKEYLPKLIGQREVDRHDLAPLSSGYFARYDPTCDASISHPFATAAFRFGHTLIRQMFPRLNPLNYANYTEPVDLVQNFNNMESLYDHKKGGIDTILMGLLGARAMAFDRHITDAVRNHLFGFRGQPLSGLDLIALNILRARDHGVQPYNSLREFCGLSRARTWVDLATEMDPATISALQSVYEHVDDVDLFPGLVSERPMNGALMPPTMACIIAEQFQRLKKCDRFYYENEGPETRFTSEQLEEIRKIRLGSLFCQNVKSLTKIQPDVFSVPDHLANSQIPCTQFPRMNLARWMERPVCSIGNAQVPRGATKLRSPCVKCTCTAEGPKCKAIRVLNCQNLLNNFLLADIREDMACVMQCASLLRNNAGTAAAKDENGRRRR
uniref:Peroxidase n=1 Tax=Globodera rostochiensis TaxID=31243 RepID=A0A914HET5_GLORO